MHLINVSLSNDVAWRASLNAHDQQACGVQKAQTLLSDGVHMIPRIMLQNLEKGTMQTFYALDGRLITYRQAFPSGQCFGHEELLVLLLEDLPPAWKVYGMIGVHEPSQVTWQKVCAQQVYEVSISLLGELFSDTGMETSQIEEMASQSSTPPPMLCFQLYQGEGNYVQHAVPPLSLQLHTQTQSLYTLVAVIFVLQMSQKGKVCLRCSTYRSPRQPFGSRFNR
jgi:hypothetical protein